MAGFDLEDMRFIPSVFSVLEEAQLPREGLVRASIMDPAQSDNFSVIGYSYEWNHNIAALPIESDRLKVMSFSLGETACEAALAYITAEESREEYLQGRAAFREQMAEIERSHNEMMAAMGRERQRAQEAAVLQAKKDAARLAVMNAAELTPDAREMVQREVMTEHPELYFPEEPDTNDEDSDGPVL